MTQLILVRHGESGWNAEGRLQGDTDVPLSPRGRRQVRQLAGLVSELGPDDVVASDLLRARETAALLGFPHARVDPAWREASLGQWTGRFVSELLRDEADGYGAWRAGLATPPDGEPWEHLVARIARAVDELLQGGGRHLVITHGGPIRAVCAHVLGLLPGSIVPVSPASVTIIDAEGSPRLRAYNLTPIHAPKEAAE